MRIGINGRFLSARRTGVQRASYNMLLSLINLDKNNEYYIFAGHDQVYKEEWQHDHVTIIPSLLREGDSIRNHIWEQFTLPRLAKRYQIDLLHSPANIAPLFYRGLSIINIHDLCFIVNPQWYSFKFRTLYNLLIPKLAKYATAVVTNSNNSKNDLLQYCDVSAEKVHMVYWAVDKTFQEYQGVSEKEDYILYVGSLEPRKNIGLLIEAYEKLRNENPDIKSKLVLIGGENPLFAEVRLKVKYYKEDVIFKGFVDDATLDSYYSSAKIMVYPSLYEGFGLPPLEAMARGTPVITSVTSSLPEVVGKAALMVSPYDVGQLTSAMKNVLLNESLQERMQAEGFEQVKKFNWYRVARNILAVYYEVYSEAHPEIGKEAAMPFDEWRRLKLIENSLVV